jgi:transcriptional regulator with XRE-family HTH domain
MGRKARMKPERLAEKLLQIRKALGQSQSELLRTLGFEDNLDYKAISQFELGNNEPPLPVLLSYALVAGVHLEDIVNDESDLPQSLPGPVKYKRIKSKAGFRGKNR